MRHTDRQTYIYIYAKRQSWGTVSDTQRETSQMERPTVVGDLVGKGGGLMAFCHV